MAARWGIRLRNSLLTMGIFLNSQPIFKITPSRNLKRKENYLNRKRFSPSPRRDYGGKNL